MAPRAQPTSRWTRARVLNVVLIGAGVMLVLLVAAQLLLPRIAAGVVRGRLGGGDEVVSVSVSAMPAIQLLWRRADRVEAHVRSFDADDVDLADELVETVAVDTLDVLIDRVRGPRGLQLDDVRVGKRGGLLSGEATIDPGELAGVLPSGVDVQPLATTDGSVQFEGRAAMFGIGTSLRLRAIVVDGRIVVRPDGLLGALANYTLFADERVEIESLTATPLPDGRVLYRATGRVR